MKLPLREWPGEQKRHEGEVCSVLLSLWHLRNYQPQHSVRVCVLHLRSGLQCHAELQVGSGDMQVGGISIRTHL